MICGDPNVERKLINRPSVSIVIPTAGRECVRNAVASALEQQGVETEIIVVYNGVPPGMAMTFGDDIRVISSPPSLGANGARQRGIEFAQNSLIALLDDDDEWEHDKLAFQVDFIVQHGLNVGNWVCGSGMLIREPNGREIAAPRHYPAAITGVGNYLFRRWSLRDEYKQLQSSTLLFPKSMAMAVPFDSNRSRHQDWTWLIEVEKKLGAQFYITPRELVHYHKSSANSITANTKWNDSVIWAEEMLANDKKTWGDFLLTIPFNMALESSELRAPLSIMFLALRQGRPGLYAVVRGTLAYARRLTLHILSRLLGGVRVIKR